MHVQLSEDREQFDERVREFLRREKPGCSDEFVRYVTERAWPKHKKRRVRLELTPAALRLAETLLAGLPDGPAADQLRDAVTGAAGRLGWPATSEADNDPGEGTDATRG